MTGKHNAQTPAAKRCKRDTASSTTKFAPVIPERFVACPFCGSSSLVKGHHSAYGDMVACDECGACAPLPRWNDRVEHCSCSIADDSRGIYSLGLSPRAVYALSRLDIQTVGALGCFLERNGTAGLSNLRGVGSKTVEEIADAALAAARRNPGA